MTTTSQPPAPGGFLQPTLPSPPPSSATSASNATSSLPYPRSTPLKPGSAKESSFIDYVDTKLLGISRRYEKRSNSGFEGGGGTEDDGRGYEGFAEMARDLEAVMEVIWVSGTPSLQTPYLLTVALTICTSLSSFPFAPFLTFRLLHKLDLAFYSLLRGVDAETDEPLSGFQGGRGRLSTTEKVRMRALVERTRVAVVGVADKGGSATDAGGDGVQTEDELTTDDDNDDDDAMEDLQGDGNHGGWEMETARVYEKTIVELGMSLDTSGMGQNG